MVRSPWEGQHLVLPEEEAFEEVTRRGLLDPAPLVETAGRWRIGRESCGQEGLVAGDEGVALGLEQASIPLCLHLVGCGFHLAQQPFALFGPRLLIRLL